MLQDPMISYAERTGFPPWNSQREPICPVCGSTCDTYYANKWGDIVGCDECMEKLDAWDMMDDE